MTLKRMILASGLVALATSASATTFTYDLLDHPVGQGARNAPFADYGLLLQDLRFIERGGFYFSFELGDAGARLTYNSEDLTASISGRIQQNFGQATIDSPDILGNAYDISYTFTGVSALDEGFFTATGGSGAISEIGGDATTYFLRSDLDPNGQAFKFNDDAHRLGRFPDESPLVGRGWVNVFTGGDSGETQLTDLGFNDFLFTAVRRIEDDLPDAEVPLPAAGWLLVAGVGALGVLGRRRRMSL